MSGPATALVPHDADEVRTRAIHLEWMRRALAVAQTLSAVEDSAAASPWGERDGDAERTLTRSSVVADPRVADRTGVADALTAGWLVDAGRGDVHRSAGPLGSLTVAVKDIIDVAGLPTRNGTPGGRWRAPRVSAEAWQRLADAGAHCVGKSATHEMAWGVTTPQVPNPVDPGRYAGGSSGGSAACVAAHVSQGALGSDTGGSIRIPAALCGVVGFRPTTGAVGSAGVTPLAPEQDTVGPLALDVPTCLSLLEVLLGRPCTPREVDPAGLRVGVLSRSGRLQPAVEHAYRATLTALRQAGVEVVACETDVAGQARSISLLTMLESSARAHAATVRADPRAFGSEARALLTLGEHLEPHAATIAEARRRLTASTERLFAAMRLDAVVTPTTPCTAPPRGTDTVDIGGRDEPVASALTRFTAWAAVTSMPAVSLPVPAGDALPVGVQVMAPPYHEHTCARLALSIDSLTS